jgi:hypothetical protein
LVVARPAQAHERVDLGRRQVYRAVPQAVENRRVLRIIIECLRVVSIYFVINERLLSNVKLTSLIEGRC